MENKEIQESKALRWICNQIPDGLGNSQEEIFVKTIKHYCKAGSEKIDKQADIIDKLECMLFLVVRTQMLPKAIQSDKTNEEICNMVIEKITSLSKIIDYPGTKLLMHDRKINLEE